jgi:hypothetical protein
MHTVLDLLRRLVYAIFLLLTGKATIEKHNQLEIYNYPENYWTLVPFPKSKGALFNADNLSTVNRHYFKSEKRFQSARAAAERRWGQPGQVRDISWRLHVCLWAFGLALAKRDPKSNGIFVECGTGQGYMAAGISDYYLTEQVDIDFFLFDTFEKLLDGGKSPADFAYADGVNEVREYFSKFSSVKIVEGKLPETLSLIGHRSIDFLHLDLNQVRYEEQVLNALADRFNESAIILFDDYGGPGGEEQAAVHRSFAKRYRREILELPTGQGVLFW